MLVFCSTTVLRQTSGGAHAPGRLLSLLFLYSQYGEVLSVVSIRRNLGKETPETYRTRMEKVLMSLSSWSNRAMDWMIMLSALLTLNLTLARE